MMMMMMMSHAGTSEVRIASKAELTALRFFACSAPLR
jgi:hypothetical protein